MTQFIGIAGEDLLDVNGYYRVVVEKTHTLALYSAFRSQISALYANLYARTQVLVPVSPNPVLASGGSDADNYVIDLGIINTDGFQAVTAGEAVRRIEGVTGGAVLGGFGGYDVRSFTALDSVADVRDNGPAERAAVQQQVTQQKQVESPFANLGHWATLVVVALVALAAIQISKDI